MRRERLAIISLLIITSLGAILPVQKSYSLENSQIRDRQTTHNSQIPAEGANSKRKSQFPAKSSSPATLDIELINPDYPNFRQAFVNVPFDLTVQFTATGFNYTQLNATIAFDPYSEGLPRVALADDPISGANTATKAVGSVTTEIGKNITWKAIPVRYDGNLSQVEITATGLQDGLFRKVVTHFDVIEIHFPKMIVEGPFPSEEHEDADYKLKYKKTKELMLNISSSINGTYNLTGVRVAISDDFRLPANYSTSEIGVLAPGEFYLYNFTVTAVSKENEDLALTITIDVMSAVTPTYRIELSITVLKYEESEDSGFSQVDVLLIFFGVPFLSKISQRRRR